MNLIRESVSKNEKKVKERVGEPELFVLGPLEPEPPKVSGSCTSVIKTKTLENCAFVTFFKCLTFFIIV